MFKPLLAAIACLVVSVPAVAQDSWASRDYDFASRQLNDFMDRYQRNLVDPVARGVQRRAAAGGGAAAKAAAAAVTTVAPRSAQVPQAMAAAYPPDQRRGARQAFEQLLASYAQIERRFGIVHYDVAGAVAAFLAGSYMGYHDTSFPDRHFTVLVAQVRGFIAADPGFRAASVEAKQEMYERLAILGMLMANTQMALQRQPDPRTAESMRRAAEAYLEGFLKTDAERVQITAQGLVIR